jgi:RNA polymerase sigma factor (sigma-70 family)
MTTVQPVKETDFSDSELVTQSLTGNRDAFGRIVARYQSLLCSLAYSATGSLSQSEDLAQETFVTAWKQLADLREPEKLRSWLCRISRNLTYDAIRRQGREPIHKAEPLEEIQESPAPEPLPSDYTVSQEEQAILWRSIERIPEIYREPLILYYREHQSVQNVAAALDLSEDAVKQRLSRGRKLLHEQVLAFVEGALERTNPGKAFTIGVLAALPAFSISAKAATVGAAAANGGATAKAAAASGLSTAVLASLLGFFGNYIAYRIGMDGAQSDHERERIKSSYRKLIACVLGFFIAYGLLMIWARQVIHDRHLMYSSVIFGLVVPFSFMLFANGIFWLRFPRKLLAELTAKGVVINPAKPAWEYRSKFSLLGLPIIHIRFTGGLAVVATPVKAWIAAGNQAVGLLFAFGGVAIAPVSMGGLALGFVSFGGCSVALLSLGGFSFGVWSFGALAFGWQVFGACAIAWNAASGGVAVAHDFAAGGIALALQANNEAARSYLRSSLFLQHAHLVLRHLAWLNLLWVIPMLARWRVVVRSRRQADSVRS